LEATGPNILVPNKYDMLAGRKAKPVRIKKVQLSKNENVIEKYE
jgi:hypothetical protein